MPIVKLSDIHKSFGSDAVLDGLKAHFYAGEKVGMIGPNGCGKTTIFRLILGQTQPDIGKVVKRKGLRVGYLPQEPVFDGEKTILEEMYAELAELLRIQEAIEDASRQLSGSSGAGLDAAMRRYDRLCHDFEVKGGYKYETKIHKILDGLGLQENLYHVKTSALSGGQLSRLGLAKALLSETDLLLLDEPTNHLDLQSTIWLEDFLKSYGGGAIIISHDRYLLDSVVCKIAEVGNGQCKIWKGSYNDYMKHREKFLLHQQRRYTKFTEMVEKTRDFIARNKDKEGMRKTARGRAKRLDKLLANEQGLPERPRQERTAKFTFSAARSRSDLVIRCEDLAKSFGELTLFDKLTFDVLSGTRLGITGPNGTGKSTFLKLALGQIEPSAGTIRMGESLTVGYLDQHARHLDPDNTVLEEAMSAQTELPAEKVRSRLGAFSFVGDDVFKKTSQLSGGQQNRLMLCKIMLQEPDVLVLDEPTNHLDIPTRETLERVLKDFDGTIIVVSHDRFFLDKVADTLLVLGVDRLGRKAIGQFEFIQSGIGLYSRYSQMVEARIAEQEVDQRAAKTKKEGRTAAKKTKKTTPAELREYNKYTAGELEGMIIELEGEISRLQEQFGDEEIYKNHIQAAKLQQLIKEKEEGLGRLYRAYELREK